MRQVVIPRFGAPDVLEIREAPDPSPGEGDIRIRVRAAGINFADILARLGLYPDAPEPPMVVDYEVAGKVDAVGRAVVGFSEGDRVVALTRFGGYADTVVVHASQAFHFPDELSDSEAAAVPVNYLTASLALYRMAALGSGRNRAGPQRRWRSRRRRNATGAAQARDGDWHRVGVQARRAAQLRRRSRHRLPPRERG